MQIRQSSLRVTPTGFEQELILQKSQIRRQFLSCIRLATSFDARYSQADVCRLLGEVRHSESLALESGGDESFFATYTKSLWPVLYAAAVTRKILNSIQHDNEMDRRCSH